MWRACVVAQILHRFLSDKSAYLDRAGHADVWTIPLEAEMNMGSLMAAGMPASGTRPTWECASPTPLSVRDDNSDPDRDDEVDPFDEGDDEEDGLFRDDDNPRRSDGPEEDI